MRYIIIICIYFLYSVGYVNSQNFEKCSSNNNSFEIDECLKKLKSKLMNKNITLVIHYSDKSIYKNKNIFLNICGNNISKYKYTDRDGHLNIKLDSKYLANSQVGLSLLSKNSYYMTSPPQKLFEYLSMGLPVIVNDVPTHTQYIKHR